jgi:hypothetical protein
LAGLSRTTRTTGALSCALLLFGCGIQLAEPTLDAGSDRATPAPKLTRADKVDLLFDIDNSGSMVEVQYYVEQAIPDLVGRLVSPSCVDAKTGAPVGPSTAGSCAAYAAATIEFPPVHDLHIGIISSSLGTRGVPGSGAVCDPASPEWNTTGPFADGQPALPTHADDRGELLNRAAGTPNAAEDETPLTDAGAAHFLDWFPSVAANKGQSPNERGHAPALTPVPTVLTQAGALGMSGTLEGDFGLLAVGVHAYGCGITSPIETWYRFLVQPDPYDSIQIVSNVAVWEGVDATIIRQRHDFLRPDSLIVIVDVSDKNDEEIDVRSLNGSGWMFMDTEFNPPRATSACATNPDSSECESCMASGASLDPSCKMNGGTYSTDDPWADFIGTRTLAMQQKYGFDAQFPLERYVLGLTSATVPDRDHEYPPGAGSYQGGTQGDPQDLACTNPLFAATLPDGSDLRPAALCNASGAGGTRSPSLVVYAHIGGVPHQLLQARVGVDKDSNGNVICPTGTDQADCPQKDTLTVADWTSILGFGTATGSRDPFDYTGIDPHMIQAYEIGRTGTNAANGRTETIPMVSPAAYPSGGGPDPNNGGDWATNVNTPNPHALPVDEEYACIFPLVTPRDCSRANDPVDSFACDCSAVGLTGTQVSPLCGLQNPSAPFSACSSLGSCTSSNDYLTQYYAKAYPTIRELTLAEMLGPQGVVSSVCPIHVTDAGGDDPLYGYRPAITSIVHRLAGGLGTNQLPSGEKSGDHRKTRRRED